MLCYVNGVGALRDQRHIPPKTYPSGKSVEMLLQIHLNDEWLEI